MNRLNPDHLHLLKAVQAADIGFWEWNLVTDRVVFSPEWKRQLGYAEDEIPNELEEWKRRLHPEDLPRVMQHDADFKSRRVSTYEVEFRLRHKNGSWRWIHSSADVIRSKNGKPLRMVGCHIDVTERKVIEAENARNFRALQVVSDANAALVRATDERAYLNEVCRIAVEIGGYRMAWVGRAECNENKIVRALAHAGFEADYLDAAAITWADCERGHGPVGTAIRTRQPSVIHDIHSHPAFSPWREQAKKRGYQSCIALPVTVDGKTWGALAAYSGEVDAFNNGEFKILEELAQDLGFGITVLRTQAEHERATEALRESERRLAEAQRVAHVGHWERDLNTGQLLLSDEIYHIFGCDPRQGVVAEANLHALLHPEDRAIQAETMAQAVRGGPRYDVEYRVIRPNGELRFVHCQGDVKRDESGHPRRMFGTMQDITERKRTEEALRQSERKLAAAQRVAHLGHWEYEFDIDRLLWSEETYRIFGQSPLRGALTKAEFKEFVHPEDINTLLEKVDQAAQGGPPYEFEYRVIRPDGEVRFVQSQGEIKWDRSGRPHCIFGVVQDVTDRRLAEESLRTSERRLAEAQRIAHVGDWDYNLQTETMSWSDEAYRIFGLSPLQPGISTLKEYQEFIHPEDRQDRAEAVYRSIRDRTDYDHEHRLIRPNGEVRFIHCRGEVTRDAFGHPNHIVGTVQDVTERRQSEEALRESERRLAEAQQIAHVGHWERDLATDLFFLSDEAQRICGRDPQATAWTLADFLAALHPDDRAVKLEAMASALRGGPYNVEYRVIRPNGELRFVHCQGEVKRDDSGRPRRMFGTIQDITDRKKSEEALRESERQLAEAQRIAHVGHWEWYIDTDEIRWSDETYRIKGVPPQSIHTLAETQNLVHPEDRPSRNEAIAQALRGGPRYDVEYRVIHPNGEIRFVHSQGDVRWDECGRPSRMFGTVQDITDRKRADEALAHAFQRIELAQQAALAAFYEFRPKTGEVVRSNSLQAILGYAPEELEPSESAWEAVIHPEDLAAFHDAVARAVREGNRLAFEYRVRHKAGHYIWLSDQARVLRDNAGEVDRFVGMIRDITSRRQAEEALRESERKLAEAQRVAHVGHWERDLNTNQILWSEETYRILGLVPQSDSRTLDDFRMLVHPEDRTHQAEALAQAMQGGPRYDVEYRIVRPNGEVRFVHSQCDVTWEESGRPRRIFGTIQDITEQKQAEEALRRSTETQRRATEIAHLGGFTFDVAKQMFQLPAETAGLLGFPTSFSWDEAMKLVHPDDLAFSQAQWQETLAGATYDVEHRIVLNGRVRWIYVRGQPEFDAEGRVIRVMGVIQDITDRRALEERLGQAQKMEAVGQLAAGVAHDFNNLMTVIIGYSYMLLRRLKAEDPMRPPVMESYKAAEQAAALTRQLLAFSRQQVLEPKVLSLETILADMEPMLQVIVGDDMRVQVHYDPEAGLVRVDPAQIQQVLINLTANARDAMSEGGVLYLATSKATVTDEYCRSRVGLKPGVYSVLTVTDSGKGMDQETLAHLFEPFFTTKGPGRGTGLGMAVVYGIVNQSRGYIEVFSQPGHGTTFNIYFPLVDERGVPEMPQSGAATSTSLPEGKETVLLVEDEEAVRTLARNVLHASGYTVLEAANGLDAIKVVQSHEGAIDLVIADVVMPYLGGRALAEKLAELKPGLKVLFISGHRSEIVGRNGLREADYPFLEKPFTPLALAQKVREMLDRMLNPETR